MLPCSVNDMTAFNHERGHASMRSTRNPTMPNITLIEITNPDFDLNDDDGLRAARGIRNALLICILLWLLAAAAVFC
jgi:hypothetical protein